MIQVLIASTFLYTRRSPKYMTQPSNFPLGAAHDKSRWWKRHDSSLPFSGGGAPKLHSVRGCVWVSLDALEMAEIPSPGKDDVVREGTEKCVTPTVVTDRSYSAGNKE